MYSLQRAPLPVLIILGIVTFLGIIPFAIVALVEAVIICFIEIPFCIKCCPTSERFDTFVTQVLDSITYRILLYVVMTVLMWLSLLIGRTWLILPAITLSVVTLLYIVAWLKKEDRVTSGVTGGTGV
ncbi:Golgi apparatus membrane protein tvp18 [Gonapodya sp. JEL0774]|nr:Golgi apparatus membrane protein tvp18 [Gonapodya sp. JEL0774]